MKRYLRVLLLYVEDVFEYRSIAIVYFLASVINPLLFLFFWREAVSQVSASSFTSIQDVNNYYFLYLILGGFLMTHIEEEVANRDIKEGGLTKYILKPFPYILSKFFLEFTWRIAMGVLSLVAAIFLTLLFGHFLNLSLTPMLVGFAIIASLLGLMISFIFKMIVGLSAFWVVDFGGLQQLVFVITLLFSGYVVPIDMFPAYLKSITAFLPIPYIIYYPIRMLQGKLTPDQTLSVIATQIFWLVILSIIYKMVWKNGLKRFTGVGL